MSYSKLDSILETNHNIFLPWNVPSYIPLNGFHPLLGRILTKGSFKIPDIKAFCSQSELQTILAKSRANLENDWHEYALNRSGYITWERSLLNRLNMEFEIHHTRIPNTEKDFALHYEDPNTLFFPSGKKSGSLKHQMQIDVEKILSNRNKLLFTHVRESAKELQDYLRREHGTTPEIEIIELPLKSKANPITKTSNPSIVFNNSMNQTAKNFIDRGGLILLNSIPQLFKKYPDLQITMIGARPTNVELLALGLSDAACHHLDKVTFYSSFVNNHLLEAILSNSWIYVIPSLNLHTDSIFRAIENECKIVTSRPYGLEGLLGPFLDRVFFMESIPTSVKQNELGFSYNSESSYYFAATAAKEELVEQISNIIESYNVHMEEYFTDRRENMQLFKIEDTLSKEDRGSREVASQDWEAMTRPAAIFDLGDEKIYRWSEFYFLDSESVGKDKVENFVRNPGELLSRKKRKEYFGYISLTNYFLSKILTLMKIENSKYISSELRRLTAAQSFTLIKRRLIRGK